MDFSPSCLSSASCEPVAIVGIGCRFPGEVRDLASFWQLLRSGRDAISEVPPERWGQRQFYHPNKKVAGKTYSRWGGFVPAIEAFDAGFFGIAPREAAVLDPQQRLLLQTSWEALEDAGLDPRRLAGSSAGVYMGAFTLDYMLLQLGGKRQEGVGPHTATGCLMTLLANRISYVLGLRGPSLTLDTACSSSLIAVHLACQALRNGETELALAGGVNAMLTPSVTIAESKAGMLSPTGRSRAFDHRADGYVRGEGAGVVVLKTLRQALADGDRIHALIRGSAANQDGRSGGLTVPSAEAQEALVREACRRAGVSPLEIDYVEAHGTGTPVGDPLEAKALGRSLGVGRRADRPCWMGSVKTNFGHTEAAAGVAGLIKAVLCLKKGEIPRHLHFEKANPEIDLEALGLRLPLAHSPWPSSGKARLAGVNSFGFGGANAHVILESAPGGESRERGSGGSVSAADKEEAGQATVSAPAVLLPISARCEAGLSALTEQYLKRLEEGEAAGESLAEIATAMGRNRAHHGRRLAVIASDYSQARARLAAFLRNEPASGLRTGTLRRAPGLGLSREAAAVAEPLAMVFSGMGPQWWAMGQELLANRVFRAAVEEVSLHFEKMAGWSLLEAMQAKETDSRMAETEVAQPANFALQVGLLALWRAQGIEPDAIVGHSTGEAAAFYAAGVYSLEEATRICYHRSRLQQKTTGTGVMAAVGVGRARAHELLRGYESRVAVAAVNSPNAVTLAGEEEALKEILAILEREGLFTRFLKVKVPYHSPFMEPIRAELLESLEGIRPQRARLPLYSTVSGGRVTGEELDAEYWWRNVRESVHFADAVTAMAADGIRDFLEVGPHPVLVASIKECMGSDWNGQVFSSLRRGDREADTLLGQLAALYCAGQEPSWVPLQAEKPEKQRPQVELPLYPWRGERYWQEAKNEARTRLGEREHPLLHNRQDAPHPLWESEIDTFHLSYLEDHQLQGNVVFPGAGYVELSLAASHALFGEVMELVFEEIRFERALFLQPEKTTRMRVSVDMREPAYEIFAASGTETGEADEEQESSGKGPGGLSPNWVRHARGKIRPRGIWSRQRLPLAELRHRMTRAVDKESCYRNFRGLGLEYGPCFQGIETLWQGEEEALARIRVPEMVAAQLGEHHIHPAVLDLCFQVLAAALPFEEKAAGSRVYMPVGVARAMSDGALEGSLWIHAQIRSRDSERMCGDIWLCGDSGEVLLRIEGCEAKSLKDEAQLLGSKPQRLHELEWRPEERGEAEPWAAASLAMVEGSVWGTWLILNDHTGVGSALAERLSARGGVCLLVRPGRMARELELGKSFELDPTRSEQVAELLAWASGPSQPPLLGVVQLWPLDARPPADASVEDLESDYRLSCVTLLHLIQELARGRWKRAPRLWAITRGGQRVTRTEKGLSPGQGALWGLARVAGQLEHKDLWGGVIDLDPDEKPSDQEAEWLAEEIWRADREDQCAYRAGVRHVVKLVERPELRKRLEPRYRADASYLITGGLGALGLVTAAHMLERGARRFLLMGREALPPRSSWGRERQSGPYADKIQGILALEARGAVMHLANLDIADEPAVRRCLEQFAAEGWPPIRGVIHAAGVATPQILLQMDREAFERVMRPKVLGAWILHQYFEAHCHELDFFTLFSSVASVVALTGQGNYAAGNSFLDQLAHYRQSLGKPGLSINWGPWGDVGMATKLDLVAYFEARGLYPMTSAQGLEAFSHLAVGRSGQATVLAANWPVVVAKNYPLGIAPGFLSELLAESGRDQGGGEIQVQESHLLARLAAAEPENRAALLRSHLGDVTAAVMGMARTKLGDEDPLNAHGMDSMIAIEWKNRVEKSLPVTIAVVDLLRGISIRELAERLLPGLEAEIEAERARAEEEAETMNADGEGEELLELLAQMDSLSPEELQALLERVESAEEAQKRATEE